MFYTMETTRRETREDAIFMTKNRVTKINFACPLNY